MTFLASLLPPWAFDGGTIRAIERFNNPAERAEMVEAIRTSFGHLDAAKFWSLNEVILPDPDTEFNHSRIDTVAREMNLEPADAMIEILARSGEQIFNVWVMQWIYSEEDTRSLFGWPHTMVGADGATSTLGNKLSPLSQHPRCWGTFPKIIKDYCLKSKLFSLENVIYRMTGLPASVIGITDRGTLQPGKMADIVVFDPNEIQDKATYTDPHRYAQGVKHIWVNGCLVLENGKRTDQKPGRVLRCQGRC
jgi:N-acyl-D-amino-acid deacylase